MSVAHPPPPASGRGRRVRGTRLRGRCASRTGAASEDCAPRIARRTELGEGGGAERNCAHATRRIPARRSRRAVGGGGDRRHHVFERGDEDALGRRQRVPRRRRALDRQRGEVAVLRAVEEVVDLLAVDLRERRVHRRPLGEPLEERGHRELDEAARRAAQRAAPHRVRLPRARLPVRQHRAVESWSTLARIELRTQRSMTSTGSSGPLTWSNLKPPGAVERDPAPSTFRRQTFWPAAALVGEERADQKRDSLTDSEGWAPAPRGHLRGRRGDAVELALLLH